VKFPVKDEAEAIILFEAHARHDLLRWKPESTKDGLFAATLCLWRRLIRSMPFDQKL
jgi:hypothetical protein